MFVLQEGLIRRCNLFLSEKCGYRPDEVAESAFASFFDADTLPAVDSVARNAAAGAHPPRPTEARLVAKDGRRLSVRLTAAPCTLSGRPAVLIVLTAAPGSPRAERWADSPEPCFASAEEELPLLAAGEF